MNKEDMQRAFAIVFGEKNKACELDVKLISVFLNLDELENFENAVEQKVYSEDGVSLYNHFMFQEMKGITIEWGFDGLSYDDEYEELYGTLEIYFDEKLNVKTHNISID